MPSGWTLNEQNREYRNFYYVNHTGIDRVVHPRGKSISAIYASKFFETADPDIRDLKRKH